MKTIKPPLELTLEMPDYLALRLRDAAPVIGCEPATLRRKCAAGLIPGAWRTSGETGDWRIPFSTLKPFLTQLGPLTAGKEGSLPGAS